MKSAFLKDTFREIRKTKSRFISIFIIVALGAGFFAGIKAVCPDMLETSEIYYDTNNLMDIRLVSTMGFTDDDVKELKKTDGILGVMPAYSIDSLIDIEGNSAVIRVHSLPFGDDNNIINKPVLVEGRLPEKSGECVIEKALVNNINFKIGDEIKLFAEKDKDINDSLKKDTYTIVGVVDTPYYITHDRGTSQIGNGSVSSFIMVLSEDFDMPVYTEVYTLLRGAKELNSYNEEYDVFVDQFVPRLEDLGKKRSEIRIDEVLSEANLELDKAKEEYNKGLQTQKEELAKALDKLNKAEKELITGEQELNKNKAEFDKLISDAKFKIEDGKKQLADAKITLQKEEKKLLEGIEAYNKAYDSVIAELSSAQAEIDRNRLLLNDVKKQLDDSKKQLDENFKKLNDGYKQIDDILVLTDAMQYSVENKKPLTDAQYQQVEKLSSTLALGIKLYVMNPLPDPATKAILMLQINTIRDQALAQRQELDKNKQQLLAAEKLYNEKLTEYNNGVNELNKNQALLNTSRQEFESKGKQLAEAKVQLQKAKSELSNKENELIEQEKNFQTQKSDGELKLLSAKEELTKGKNEFLKGKKEFEEGKEKSDKELFDAKEKIADAELEISKLKEPTWYVFDRDNIPAHSDFYSDAEKVDAIAKIFPVFFILVAALVCMTTMTRMVEEQRTQIGTVKALGYSKGIIISKYLVYGGLASLLGSITGLIIGFKLFPTIVFNAYGILYNLPDVITPFRWVFGISTVVVSVVCVILVVFYSCYKELSYNPATLMRPKPPKNGKRVLLERVPFIWNHLSFIQKVTVRNLFRYKKRIFMTLLGIAGCTALMLVGFGVKDSISDIVNNQFSKDGIFKYDLTAIIEPEKDKEFYNKYLNDERISSYAYSAQIKGQIKHNDKKLDMNLLVPETLNNYKDFVSLRTRIGHNEVPLTNDGIVISEKTSKMLNIKIGDEVEITDDDKKTATVKVTGICENYTFHYVYLSPESYTKLFNKNFKANSLFVNLKENSDENLNAISEQLLSSNGVMAVTQTKTISKTFGDLIKSLNVVVLVLIFTAGALALVVLYNLTNINVNERIREIATLKVLGFYDKEVTSYIYRENIILTIIGIGIGLLLGIGLHSFVMNTVETEIVMFGRTIKWLSFVLAAIITFIFSFIVNLFLHITLKKVKMVESLKSIE